MPSRIALLATLCALLPTLHASQAPKATNFGKFVILSTPVTWQEYPEACRSAGYDVAMVSTTTDMQSVRQAVNSVSDKTVWVEAVYEEGGHLERFAEQCAHFAIVKGRKGDEVRLVKDSTTQNNPLSARQPLCMLKEGEEWEPAQSTPQFVTIPINPPKQPASQSPFFGNFPFFNIPFLTIPFGQPTKNLQPATDKSDKSRKSTDPQFTTLSITCSTKKDGNGNNCKTCKSVLVLRGSDLPEQSDTTSTDSSSTSAKPKRKVAVKGGKPKSKGDDEKEVEKAVNKNFTGPSWEVGDSEDSEEDKAVQQSTQKSDNVLKAKPVFKVIHISGNTNPQVKVLSVTSKQSDCDADWTDLGTFEKRESAEKKEEAADETLIKYKPRPASSNKSTINIPAKAAVVEEKAQDAADEDATDDSVIAEDDIPETKLEEKQKNENSKDETNNADQNDSLKSSPRDIAPLEKKKDEPEVQPATAPTVPHTEEQPAQLLVVPKNVEVPATELKSAETEAMAATTLNNSLIDSTMVVSIETAKVETAGTAVTAEKAEESTRTSSDQPAESDDDDESLD